MSNTSQVEKANKGLVIWGLDQMQDSQCVPTNWLNCKRDGVPTLYESVLGLTSSGPIWIARVPGAERCKTQYVWQTPRTGMVLSKGMVTDWCYVGGDMSSPRKTNTRLWLGPDISGLEYWEWIAGHWYGRKGALPLRLGDVFALKSDRPTIPKRKPGLVRVCYTEKDLRK